MNPDASLLWRGPRWTLAVLLACLGMLGPFSIDTYLPAFTGIAESLGATPVQMQQTLSAYLFGFAVMNLFHGALSDSFGRRPVVLGGVALFTLASVGCALSQTIGALVFFRALQGMSRRGRHRGVARHHPRHVPAGRRAARDVAGDDLLRRRAGGRAAWSAASCSCTPTGIRSSGSWPPIGVVLLRGQLAHAARDAAPHAGAAVQRAPPAARLLADGHRAPRFITLALASGIPFNGMFLYVLSAPVFLGEHLRLGPTQFFWFFCLTIGGIMGGAWLSRAAGGPHRAASARSATAS